MPRAEAYLPTPSQKNGALEMSVTKEAKHVQLLDANKRTRSVNRKRYGGGGGRSVAFVNGDSLVVVFFVVAYKDRSSGSCRHVLG